MSLNILWQNYKITKLEREKLHKHKSFLIWFTGLSGSGKSTLANLVEVNLNKKGVSTYVLDGDNIRKGVNKDLDFSPQSRSENIRRVSEISHLMIDAGLVTLCTFVSPYINNREIVKKVVGEKNFIEIYVNASLEVCENRDVKGLYKKARTGVIKNMTGISAPYEAPQDPDLEIFTDRESIDESVKKITDFIEQKIKLST